MSFNITESMSKENPIMSSGIPFKVDAPIAYDNLVDVVPDNVSVADYLDAHEQDNLEKLTQNLVYEIRRAVRSKPALLVFRMHRRYTLEKALFQSVENKCSEIFGANLGSEMFENLLMDTRAMLAQEGLCLIDETTGTGEAQYSIDRLPEKEKNSPLRQKLDKKMKNAPKTFVPGPSLTSQYAPTRKFQDVPKVSENTEGGADASAPDDQEQFDVSVGG